MVVTGATGGVGRATARLFAAEGATVVVVDRDPAGGEATVAAIRDDGGEAIFQRADVSREADCAAMIETAISQFGRLDILHNHAGILHPGDGPITELTEAVIDETFAINCKGMLFAAKHAVRHMIRAGGGAIVNTGSDLDIEKRQKGFGVINGRIGLHGRDDRWGVELWAQNLLDTKFKQVAFDMPLQGSCTERGAQAGFCSPRT